MKNILPLFIVMFVISCSSQKNVSPGKTDSTVTVQGTEPEGRDETKSATPTKSIILNNPDKMDKTQTSDKKTSAIILPTCLKNMIEQIKKEEVQNPPKKIYSYLYKGKTVYYVTAQCCDFFSDLYDEDCKLIAHPDGGITGKGDGRARDFVDTRRDEKLVWEDSRK